MIAEPTAATRLARDGIASAGRVDAQVVATTRDALDGVLPADRSGLHFATSSRDVAYRSALSAVLGDTLAPAVAPMLSDAVYRFGVCVAQGPGVGTGMGHHHDLTFTTDETMSLVVWVPLSDVGLRTGTLSVLLGSHHDVVTPRGTPTFPSPFDAIPRDRFEAAFRPVIAPAGTVVGCDPRLAHHSTDNLGSEERLTAVLLFTRPAAQLVHHYLHPDGRVERFAVDAGFYTRFDLNDPPVGERSLGVTKVRCEPMTSTSFTQRYPPSDEPFFP